MDNIDILKYLPLDEVLASFKDIPFGNSDFQTDNFIINAALTPERAFRIVGLQIRSRVVALREAYYSQKRLTVDLDEIDWRLSNDKSLTDFGERRLAIDKEQKMAEQVDGDKLIADALHELNHLVEWWKKLPHPTREEFEKKEEMYFKQSLLRQARGITGALESLTNMGLMIDEGELKKIPAGL